MLVAGTIGNDYLQSAPCTAACLAAPLVSTIACWCPVAPGDKLMRSLGGLGESCTGMTRRPREKGHRNDQEKRQAYGRLHLPLAHTRSNLGRPFCPVVARVAGWYNHKPLLRLKGLHRAAALCGNYPSARAMGCQLLCIHLSGRQCARRRECSVTFVSQANLCDWSQSL